MALCLGVLASGGGSNLQSILDACDANTLDAKVKVVISDNPKAFALE
ncbi:phosphoribosylglycinamide formyltransferase, partial [bacterium]